MTILDVLFFPTIPFFLFCSNASLFVFLSGDPHIFCGLNAFFVHIAGSSRFFLGQQIVKEMIKLCLWGKFWVLTLQWEYQSQRETKGVKKILWNWLWWYSMKKRIEVEASTKHLPKSFERSKTWFFEMLLKSFFRVPFSFLTPSSNSSFSANLWE